jgi:hypothetical protein
MKKREITDAGIRIEADSQYQYDLLRENLQVLNKDILKVFKIWSLSYEKGMKITGHYFWNHECGHIEFIWANSRWEKKSLILHYYGDKKAINFEYVNKVEIQRKKRIPLKKNSKLNAPKFNC